MFAIVTDPIDLTVKHADSTDPRVGAVSLFTGTVRNLNDGKEVLSLEYECYQAMAIKEGNKILEEARDRFGVLAIHAEHRIGHLRIGETAIKVAAFSAHRREAIQACSWTVDQIKGRVPIWKKEHYRDGGAEWIYCPSCEIHDPGLEHDMMSGDNHLPENMKKSVEKKKYFSAQLNMSSIGTAGMDKLNKAQVTVVGAGGLGSAALVSLARMGVGRLIIVDDDKVAASNLARQILYTTADIKINKTEAAAAALRKINPWVEIETINLRLGEDNIDRLTADISKQQPRLIIDGSDNFLTKFLIHDYCYRNHIDLIQAGVFQTEGRLNNFFFSDAASASSPCLRCLYPEQPPDCGESCAETGILASTVTLFGTLQAHEAVKRILGHPGLLQGKTLIWDLEGMASQTLGWKKSPNCVLCGDAPAPLSEQTVNQVEKIETGDIVIATPDVSTELFPISTRLSMNDFGPNRWDEVFDHNKRYVLVCRRGIRSYAMVQFLNRQGFVNVYSLKNGIEGYEGKN